MRVLISAFAFSPYRGSEAAVGWNIATELAKLHDVTVITGAVRAESNDWSQYVREKGPISGLAVEYVEPTRFIQTLERLHHVPGCWGLYYWAYNLWQRKAFQRAKELNAQKRFDLVHQLNMIGYREPGYMWKLGIPFVWGPVGGAPNESISYHSLFSCAGCIKVFLRTICNEVQKSICWRARIAAKHARKIWVVTDADYQMVRDIWGVRCEKMVETGTVLRPEGFVRDWDGNEPFRIVWSGIHTSRKALPILIFALNKIASENLGIDRDGSVMQRRMDERIKVDVLGEGPETRDWKRLAERLGVASCLKWHGRLPHDQALSVMNHGHVFAFPSLKEGTPHVVLEALSLGLPVICHDACGMGTVVDGSCGVKIPLKTPDKSIEGFSNALSEMLSGRISIASLSKGALDRAQQLTWAEKASKIAETYKEIVHG